LTNEAMGCAQATAIRLGSQYGCGEKQSRDHRKWASCRSLKKKGLDRAKGFAHNSSINL
jgi:hypothetical protein